ncbi:UNVERIFIED_CONTAM: hypothetical protein FKN15_026323 [Acipenser sinensis]
MRNAVCTGKHTTPLKKQMIESPRIPYSKTKWGMLLVTGVPRMYHIVTPLAFSMQSHLITTWTAYIRDRVPVCIHSEATRPIVPENNTDLNGSTADPQAPYQPQGSLVRSEPWIALPT